MMCLITKYEKSLVFPFKVQISRFWFQKTFIWSAHGYYLIPSNQLCMAPCVHTLCKYTFNELTTISGFDIQDGVWVARSLLSWPTEVRNVYGNGRLFTSGNSKSFRSLWLEGATSSTDKLIRIYLFICAIVGIFFFKKQYTWNWVWLYQYSWKQSQVRYYIFNRGCNPG